MHRFYAPDITTTMLLPDEEAQHCVRVLRLKEGEEVEVVDGKGHLHLCRILNANAKNCAVEIVRTTDVKPHWGCRITVAIAPTKNIDRMEWMAEKVTEMGVDRIVPLLCRYSERKVLKTERLRKILVAAMKQSLKATLPQFDDLTPFDDFMKALPDGQRFIAYCDPAIPRRDFVKECLPESDVTILVGPEGDFSQPEIHAALDAGFIPVSLGDSRLRTETAGVFACAAIHTINQLKK
uniref:16S rRNA (uracil(1498)-N(3))-methyltransferase n=1 Tax=Candidatus Limisoma sp. TaxID=3076476 RepID=UPI0040264FC8